MSVTTAQIESVGGLTAVAEKSDVPATLNYEISVTPDANSASGYADGIISTTFTVSVMEGRSDGEIEMLTRDEIQTLSVAEALGLGIIDNWGFVYMGVGSISCIWDAPGTGTGITHLAFVSGFWVEIDYDGDTYENFPTYGSPQGPFDLSCSPYGSGSCTPGSLLSSTDAEIAFTKVSQGVYSFVLGTDLPGLPAGTYQVDTNNFVDPSNPTIAEALSGSIQQTTQIPLAPYLHHYNELAAQVTAIDTATASGGISQFVKTFNYQSGITCANC
jgi:hypothetical protein